MAMNKRTKRATESVAFLGVIAAIIVRWRWVANWRLASTYSRCSCVAAGSARQCL